MRQSIVTLTTDFGRSDSYVAQMKGIMLGINPRLQLVDATHAVPPQNVLRGAAVLDELTETFPEETIHLAVVDPGVGTPRRLVGVEMNNQRFIAPDNGILGLVLRRHEPVRIVELTARRFWRQPVSATFHGRDIMGPVAAHWSLGVDLAEFGRPLDGELTELPIRQPVHMSGAIVGEILWADAFGNLTTNIDESLLPPTCRKTLIVQAGAHLIHGIHECYGEQADGGLLALVGSNRRLEIAVNRGSAADRLRLKSGDEVRVLECESAGNE